MTGDFYYCEACDEVRGEDDTEISTRVSRPGAWGCGLPGCDSCHMDRPSPVAFCPEDGAIMTLIDDEDVDPGIFDYLLVKSGG